MQGFNKNRVVRVRLGQNILSDLHFDKDKKTAPHRVTQRSTSHIHLGSRGRFGLHHAADLTLSYEQKRVHAEILNRCRHGMRGPRYRRMQVGTHDHVKIMNY